MPAVAVKREGRALFVIIGRKGYAGGPMAVNPENPEPNSGKGFKRMDSSHEEDSSTFKVEMKNVDIKKTPKGEDNYPLMNWRWGTKA